MINPKRTIIILNGLLFGVFLIFVGNGLVLTSAGIMLKNFGINDFLIGIITSCFFLGAIGSSIFGYKFISSLGYIRSYAIFTSLFAISAVLHGLSENVIYWAFLRFMLGFSYYGIVMVVESWINAKSRNEIRSRVLGFYAMLYYGGFCLGAMILALNLNPSKIFTMSVFFILLGSIPMNIIKIKEPFLPPKRKISIPNVFNLVPLALVTSFTSGIVLASFFTMSSVFIISVGGDIKDISSFVLIAMVGGFLSELFFGFFSDKFGRKIAILLGSFISLISAIFMYKNLQNILILKILVFFLAFGTFSLYSLALARANDMLKCKNESAKVGAELLFTYSFGSLTGPILTGIFMEIFGDKGFVFTYLIFLSLLFIFTLTQEMVPKEKRSKYVIKKPSRFLR